MRSGTLLLSLSHRPPGARDVDSTLLEVLSLSKDGPEPVEGKPRATPQIGIQIVFTCAVFDMPYRDLGRAALHWKLGITAAAKNLRCETVVYCRIE